MQREKGLTDSGMQFTEFVFIKMLITLDSVCNFHNGLTGEAFIKAAGNHHGWR